MTSTATKAASTVTKAAAGKQIIVPYASSQKVGVVVSAGKMSRAVKVRVAGQEWNKKFRKVRSSPRAPSGVERQKKKELGNRIDC
jgi:hypothetical protein